MQLLIIIVIRSGRKGSDERQGSLGTRKSFFEEMTSELSSDVADYLGEEKGQEWILGDH